MYYYLNEDKTYRKCTVEEWCEQIHTLGTEIKKDYIGEHLVSTLWLGMDPSYEQSKKPILFQTMIFYRGPSCYQERFSTYEEAIQGHKDAIEWAKEIQKQTLVDDLFEMNLSLVDKNE